MSRTRTRYPHLALGRIDTEAGKRAFLRAVQKFMEGQHAAH